ncbi:acyl-CoA-binding domain-containing protein 5-B isoform X2 [Onychostoma macrolepis]|nr:acyl-CoA-binding domain-containing protein 5-B isoform X2 [Onychostoma macrolepis]XP_058655194.1 acyl-CoA-binding domain-containing protein 5-B isoform X2 [Onychostoma macrolepis]XP_058655202.1 acyl-CoA-binding domain-containing protein 5-B isoform X2 [Onychostoma macrolepis]
MTRRAMEDPKSIQRRFEAAVKVIRNLPEDGSYDLSDDMLVIFYSYYKQATAGPCNTPKPNFWDPIGKAKWEAWKTLGNMSKEQAMMEYVQEIQLIIETLPVTDRMAELMDALDPFYEMADDDDDDDEDEAVSKTAPFSTGNTYAEKTDDDAAEKVEEGEGEINGESKEDDMEMEERRKDSSTFAAGRGGLSLFNGSEENSTSSSADDAHSSLNTEEEEEELAHDDSDDEMYGDSMENPATQEKGSGVPRVHLADVSVAGAHMHQEGNREPRCGSQDGKPQGATPPVPHPPTLGPVRIDRISAGSGRGHQLTGTNLPDEHDNLSEHSCQGNGQCWETEERADKQAFNPQIAVILSQLQDNMQDVLHRLTTLELLTASQAEILPLKARHSKSPKKRLPWWPLNLSPITVALTVIWPFAVHWLVQFYLQKRKRWLRVK